jgi:hypothetical protein
MISFLLSVIPWWLPAVAGIGAQLAAPWLVPALPQWARTAIVVCLIAAAVYAKGKQDCAIEVVAAQKAERARQVAINEMALKDALISATNLALERDRLAVSLKGIVDEVRNSPGGSSCGLDADSLRKLERLTAPRPH